MAQPPSPRPAPAHSVPTLDDPERQARWQARIDRLTKPLGALGQIEALALQLAMAQGLDPAEPPRSAPAGDSSPGARIALDAPQALVFAADHGLAREGVSAYPQEVTAQMVLNMVQGGAAVSVLARLHGFDLTVVDAGVAHALPLADGHLSAAGVRFASRPLGPGTANPLQGPAMDAARAQAALDTGAALVRALPGRVLALGEMGIGNTSSAALLFAALTGEAVQDLVGRGTGLDDTQLTRKREVLVRVADRHGLRPGVRLPAEAALQAVGGFEIGMMAGALLQGARERRVLLLDGFIAGAAALLACAIVPAVAHHLVLCHRSAEAGHRRLLQHLLAGRPSGWPQAPLLDLDLRLGEGSGALLAWPLVQAAAALLHGMASFDDAGISGPALDAPPP